jgi:hypothetical protein
VAWCGVDSRYRSVGLTSRELSKIVRVSTSAGVPLGFLGVFRACREPSRSRRAGSGHGQGVDCPARCTERRLASERRCRFHGCSAFDPARSIGVPNTHAARRRLHRRRDTPRNGLLPQPAAPHPFPPQAGGAYDRSLAIAEGTTILGEFGGQLTSSRILGRLRPLRVGAEQRAEKEFCAERALSG